MSSSMLLRQRQFPRLDPVRGLIVSGTAKLDVVCWIVTREHPFRPFVELLGESGEIFFGIELRFFQLFWMWFNGMCDSW